MTLKENLSRYLDAGFPILYINTFEEAKVEETIRADIEGVVKDAIEYAFADDKTSLSTQDIIRAIGNTNSLSVIMKEPLEKMTKEYEKRKLKSASR